MQKTALRLGLQPNTALGFALCCNSLSTVPLRYIALTTVSIYGTPHGTGRYPVAKCYNKISSRKQLMAWQELYNRT